MSEQGRFRTSSASPHKTIHGQKIIADQEARSRALDPSTSFIVQAPAGSGKTGLLTQRFLVLLASVDAPEEIVAITFTRKAASEMRQRILQALERAGSDQPPERDHERRTWKLARHALVRDKALGWQLLDNPARLRIQTIDSLCTALARQMPIGASHCRRCRTTLSRCGKENHFRVGIQREMVGCHRAPGAAFG